MVARDVLVAELNELLDPAQMPDHGPNGLQVEGKDKIARITTAVTASAHAIDTAIDQQADALLVHHGILWNRSDGPAPLTGWHGDRVRKLMRHDVNLIAYHLPLDLHPTLGNNRALLDGIGLDSAEPFGELGLGQAASYEHPIDVAQLMRRVHQATGRPPMHLDGGPPAIQKVGVVTGAGQRWLDAAIDAGCDAFITGEASEYVTHVAREAGIHYVWAGHHATERGGIQRLGEHLKAAHRLTVSFVDEQNPV